MLISTFAFSLMTLFVKFLPNIHAFEIIFFRSLISLIISFTALRMKRIYPLGVNKKYLVMRGLFGVTALTLFFITLQNVPLANAVTIQYLSPIFTAIFAIFMLGERLKWLQGLFFFISFYGVILIKGFDERVDTLYLILGITSAVFAGLAYNCIRKVKDTDHPLVVVLYFPLVATPLMGVLSYFKWVTPTLEEFGILLGIGIATQFGQVFMTKALQAENAAKISAMKYFGTVYALLYGYLFFSETYSTQALLGIGLVILGVLLNVGYKAFKVKN